MVNTSMIYLFFSNTAKQRLLVYILTKMPFLFYARTKMAPTRAPHLTRWSSQLAFMSRLLRMNNVVNHYLQACPINAQRGLAPSEWVTLQDVCSTLEPILEVVTSIQTGPSRLLRDPIFLCYKIIQVTQMGIVEIIGWKRQRDPNSGQGGRRGGAKV